MRILPFFISLYFFVLGYGNNFAVEASKLPLTHSIVTNFQKNQLQQYHSKEHTNLSVFEFTDIELEEDYHSNEDSPDFKSNFLEQNSCFDNWISIAAILFQSNYRQKGNFSTFFVALFAIPIYLKNQVLRI